MPHIRCRAVPPAVVENLSRILPGPLAQIMETSEDNFTFELIGTQFYEGGQAARVPSPFIEVHWFRRSQEIQNRSAEMITQTIQTELPNTDITVIFLVLEPYSYYENGKHFGG